MMLFRSVQKTDAEAIYHLSEHSGIGLTTLPKEKDLLLQRIAWSCTSFNKVVHHPTHEYYLFVLEEPQTGKVVGVSAIESAIGHESPFYSYKLSKRTRICHALKIRSDYELLSLVNDNQGRSELCTLFLEPTFRHHGNGLLLSRARFLFMAHYPTRFASTVIADMRGVSDEWGNSPFWESMGRHFFHMSFAEADRLTLSTNKQFIADLMPRNPIYVKLLALEAQSVLGKPHPSTLSAMNILLREGFRYNGYIDIFDAGPTIEAPFSQIRTIAASRMVTISGVNDSVFSNQYLIANTKPHFRATISAVLLHAQEETCIINNETAHLLEVKKGDCLRIVPLCLPDLTT